MRSQLRKSHYLITGLGLGDEGKGSVVDYLVRREQAAAVLRYNGGPQAAHHVVEPSGRWHCFSQFGSGTFVPGVWTHLSSKMLIKPENLLIERGVLEGWGIRNAMSRLTIDPNCVIVTPLHQMIGQMLELVRGKDCHGSTGMGVGQAVFDHERSNAVVIRLMDFFNPDLLREKIRTLIIEKFSLGRHILKEQYSAELKNLFESFARKITLTGLCRTYTDFVQKYPYCFFTDSHQLDWMIGTKETLIFEGAQGALLDRVHGFYPYVTKTRTSVKQALDLIGDRVSPEQISRMGVMRAYAIRHGAGPFVTEDKELSDRLPELHNGGNPWQGKFRVGWFDLLAIRYGVLINGGVDTIALTCLDRMSGLEKIKVCVSYEYTGSQTDLLDNFFEWRKRNGHIEITGFKLIEGSGVGRNQLAHLLFDCRPLKFLKFKGWSEDLSKPKKIEDLPRPAHEYLNFLESSEGVGIPISLISCGPTWADKLEK